MSTSDNKPIVISKLVKAKTGPAIKDDVQEIAGKSMSEKQRKYRKNMRRRIRADILKDL